MRLRTVQMRPWEGQLNSNREVASPEAGRTSAIFLRDNPFCRLFGHRKLGEIQTCARAVSAKHR